MYTFIIFVTHVDDYMDENKDMLAKKLNLTMNFFNYL